ncbi:MULTISPECIES: ArsA-related P-loop ATPase [unclassified Nocardiopsis]|uniref:ArsA-related P-loop ATPase n=1 Tax=unclassified Nocardiopsis TaxID=2649073 RepID=UPI00135790D3|nr:MULTISPECIES: ArsA-related P-loop ATPase [unclassified Nocardiopsis]
MSEGEHGPRPPADARARLHIVTGKGGTGKTTAAAALARALAADGGRVLLVEVEGRQGLATLLGVPPLPYEEREMLSVPGGGTVCVLAADPEAALLEYLEMFYGMRRAGQALNRLGAVDFATTIAPGLRDVLLTGKATEAVRRRRGARRRSADAPATAPFHYDAVVMDAPPTGRIARFLNVNSEVAGLARVGPVRNHADRVMEVIRSAQTRVHFVSLLEEMPVQETREGIAELAGLGIPVGTVLVNMVRPPLLAEADLAAAASADGADTDALSAGLKEAGLEHPGELAAALAGEVRAHALRVGLERRMRAELEALGRPLLELPLLEGGVDRAALELLARRLSEQGVRR